MAMLVMDGFNSLRYRNGVYISQAVHNSGFGRYADGGIRFYGGRGAAWEIPGTPSGDTLIMGTTIYPWNVTLSNSYDAFGFSDGAYYSGSDLRGADRQTVRIGNDGTLYVYNTGSYGGSSLAGTSTRKITKANWYCMELKVKYHASAGTIDLYVDGENWISVTGLNTGAFPLLYVLRAPADILGDCVYYDDTYIMDNSGSFNNAPLGNWRVRRVVPNADTAQKDLTPLSGTSNYAMVDDSINGSDGATTYVYTTTTGADVYDMNTISGLKKIGAVQVVAAASTTMGNDIIPLAVVGTTTSTTTDKCQLNFVDHFHIMNNNPETAAAFTQSDIDSIKAGVKVP